MVLRGWLGSAFLVLALVAPAPGAAGGARPNVDIAIVFAIDSSSSVDGDEFALQVQGTAAALRSSAVAAAIRSGAAGQIAASYLFWGGAAGQNLSGGWAILSSAESIDRFADALEAQPRPLFGDTAVGNAVVSGLASLDGFQGEAARRVIDVSGDGSETGESRHWWPGAKPEDWGGTPAMLARDLAEQQGVTINCLAVIDEEPGLAGWFRRHVATANGGFVIEANSWAAFKLAITRKITRELFTAAGEAVLFSPDQAGGTRPD